MRMRCAGWTPCPTLNSVHPEIYMSRAGYRALVFSQRVSAHGFLGEITMQADATWEDLRQVARLASLAFLAANI